MVYAWKTKLPRDPASRAPYDGWVHEDSIPYRVISFATLEEAQRWVIGPFEIAEYDGTANTVPWQEVWPHLIK